MPQENKNSAGTADDWLEATVEDLPTLEEIERFAEGERAPKRWSSTEGHWAVKILFVLTNQKYAPAEAEKLWLAILDHEKWMAARLGRKVGVSIAAMDYLTNVADQMERPVIVEEEQMGKMTDTAAKDGLTGLYGREVFDHLLEKMVAEARRYGTPLSLLMADIDDFKEVNDRHGHQMGDEVLERIGTIILENVRSADLAARYGGEELAVILPHTAIRSAQTVAENIRTAVMERFENELKVTISIGVAAWQPHMNHPANLVRAADSGLYAAKEGGKNKVALRK
jgi:diguanylate cyclase (GGDEF)-like protein